MLMGHTEEPEGGRHEPDLEEIYKKTHEIAEGSAIDMDTFRDLYGDEVVDRDKKEVEYLEGDMRRRNEEEWGQLGERKRREYEQTKKLAEIFETIFYEHAELSDWLGPNATVIKASRFDDYLNGIDAVVEFAESDASRASHLALAVDVTTAHTERVLRDKLVKIRSEIEDGKLAWVKYFKSEDLSMRGELKDIPRTVIAADALKTVGELGKLFVGEKNKELAVHPIQHQIIDELLMQLQKYTAYAQERGEDKLYRRYRKILGIVETIKMEKSKPGEVIYDEGYRLLEKTLDDVFKFTGK